MDKISSDPVNWVITFALLGIVFGHAMVMSLWVTNGLVPKLAKRFSWRAESPFVILAKLFLFIPIAAALAFVIPFLIRLHKLVVGGYGGAWLFFVFAVITFLALFREGFEIKWRD